MNITRIIFSPTGGTRKVSEHLAVGLGKTVTTVDLTDGKLDFSGVPLEKEGFALLAVPSYGGRVPALAAQRIRQLTAHGTPCVIVCVYGNRAYEDTLVELYDLAVERGFSVVAAVSAVAEHSMLHQYGTDRPDRKDQEELVEFGRLIGKKQSGELSGGALDQLPGNRPYKKAAGGFAPKARKNCVNCGICAKKCPAQAIPRDNCKTVDKTKCIGCMRCVTVCPHDARGLNPMVLKVAGLALKSACAQRKHNELFL